MDNRSLMLQKNQYSRNLKSASTEKVINLVAKATQLQREGQFEKSLQILAQSAFLKPDFAEIYTLRAQIHLKTNSFDKALAEFNKAIELNQNNAANYIERGELYRKLKQADNALGDLDQALKLEPENTLALGRRGTIYRNTGDYALALLDFNLAIQLDAENPWLYGNRAETYRSLGEYRKAIGDYNRVLELNHQLNWVYERRAYTYLWLGYLDSARSDFEQSGKVNPQNRLVGWFAEWVNMCKKNFSFSTEIESRLLNLVAGTPLDYGAYLIRGGLYWFQNDFSGSYNEFDKACELEPAKTEAYFWKGMAAACLEKDTEALDLVQAALDLRLPPVLLGPAMWLKTLNPTFFLKFDRCFLTRRERLSFESEDIFDSYTAPTPIENTPGNSNSLAVEQISLNSFSIAAKRLNLG